MLVKQLVKFSILILISCSATTPQKLSSFPLLDNRGILHEYRTDHNRITHPKVNDKLTLYCASHFQWETLKIVWRRSDLTKIGHREENSYWRWTYIVSRNKKQ